MTHPSNARLPLTEGQREMLAAMNLDEDANRPYSLVHALTLVGPLDIEALEDALADVVARHAALRVRILPELEQQEIAASARVPLQTLDLSATAATEQRAAVEKVLQDQLRKPVTPLDWPLMRVLVVRLAPDRNLLVVAVHHIVCDGWSTSVFFGDLGKAYQSALYGLQAELPPAGSYEQFVRRESESGHQQRATESLEFWKRKYADGAPVLRLPEDFPRPAVKTFNGGRCEVPLQAERYARIRQAGARQGCTLFVTLLAGYELLLHQLSGQRDIVLGIPVAEQASMDNPHLIAHAVNTVPLRSHIDPQATVARHMANTRGNVVDSLENQFLTFGTLVQALRLPRDPSRTPLVCLTFNIDKLTSPFDFGPVKVESIAAPGSHIGFELMINVVDSGADAVLVCDFNSDLYAERSVRGWIEAYLLILDDMLADPAALVAALPRRVAAAVDSAAPVKAAVPAPAVQAAAADTIAIVTRVYEEILDRSVDSPDDNFFDLGGHSLMAAKLVTRLKAQTGVDVRLRDVFEHQTVATMAACVERKRWLAGGGSVQEEVEI